jgi:RNA recognition motif-containing protein
MRQDKFRGNVFVANLPQGFTDERLAATFDEFGLVLGAFLARDLATGAAKTHGLVSLAPDRAAAEAIAALNGTKIDGRKIEVRKADPEMALAIPRPPRSRPSFHAAAPAPRAPAAPAAPRSAAPASPSFVVERVRSRRVT